MPLKNMDREIGFSDIASREVKIITKYFDPKYTDEVSNGRFRFGTNRGYRRPSEQASTQGTLDDESEGDLIFDFRIKPSKVKLFETPILTVKNGITPAVNVKFAWWVNDHTFCATSGEYNPEHHKKMVYGHEANGYKYIGNSAYTSYCEIDLKKFLYSLVWEVLKLKSHTSGNLPSLLVGKVLYDDRVKVISYVGVLPENYNYNDDMIYHAKMAAFSKQPRFEIENEIRIITPLFGFGRTPVDAGPIFFQSNGIKSSILKIGSLE